MPGRVVMVMVDDGMRTFQPGVYLRWWDHELCEGHGDGDFTRNIEEAVVFPSIGEALEFWRQVSKRRPVRPDGKPNRPLTRFTVTFETAELPSWWNSLVNKSANDG